MRYKLVEGSESYHCCFGWSVVDTAENGYYDVCECFEKEPAELICKLLNLHYHGNVSDVE